MANKFQQPIVAIVGRPNVGKSTFFNRICGSRIAIESDIPKTTRDRIYGNADWCGKSFILVDTAGLFEKDRNDNLQEITKSAVETAIKEADKIIFLLDATDSVTSYDREIAKALHKSSKDIFLVVNKADNAKREMVTHELLSLGFKNPNFVSAISGRGLADFLDLLTADFSAATASKSSEEIIDVAIVGRPNVGKSTLLNTLVGEEKAIVSKIPGTTRDTTDAIINFKNQKIRVVDTAGIRRPGKIGRQIEKFSVIRALRAIKESTVVIILFDGIEGVTNQDAHLAGFAKDQGKSIIVAINKLDLWNNPKKIEERKAFILNKLRLDLAFLPFVPVIFISAKIGSNLKIMLKKIVEIYNQRFIKIEDNQLKEIMSIADRNKQLPQIIDFYQEKTNPVVFKLVCKNKNSFHFSHLRYLENVIRDEYPFFGTPIFIDLINSKKS